MLKVFNLLPCKLKNFNLYYNKYFQNHNFILSQIKNFEKHYNILPPKEIVTK